MTTERIAELTKRVNDLGNLKLELSDQAIGDWCNGLICLSAALHHEAKEPSRRSHPPARQVVKLVAVGLLALAALTAPLQAATWPSPTMLLVTSNGVSVVASLPMVRLEIAPT